MIFHYYRIGIIIPKEGEKGGEPEPIESDRNRIKLIKLEPPLWLVLPECERKTFLLEKIENAINSEE